MTDLEADAARRFATLQGQDWLDDVEASRIAFGAEAATAAVMAALAETSHGLAAPAPSDFLATLEALAEDPR